MQGYVKYIPFFKRETSVIGIEYRINDLDKSRIQFGTVRSPKCSKCRYTNQCEGLWENYAGRYGLGELKPIGDSSR